MQTSLSRLLGLLLTLPAASFAQETLPDWNAGNLTGDWNGNRKSLYQKGLDIGLLHKSDILSNVKGGLEEGTEWMGHTEATLSVDLEKLLGWNATTAYFHFQSDLGSKFNTNNVGAFMGVDNIEVGTNTAQFYHAWIEKSFLGGRLAIKGGLYPIDSEFYVTETAGLFLAPPYGMSNEVAQTDTPAIFPLGALGLRLKLTSQDEAFYAMGAVMDGRAGDPGDPRHTQITLADGDGSMSIVEFGYTPPPAETKAAGGDGAEAEEVESFNKTAIGFWRYTRQDADIDGSGTGHSSGAYFLAERSLFAETGAPSQGLAGFVRFGTASESLNQVDWTASVGLRYRGLFPGRDDDLAGIAITYNHAGDDFRKASRAAGDSTTESAETDWEFTYRAQIKDWLALQPNLQYIRNPGMDRDIDNAWIVGLRTEVVF